MKKPQLGALVMITALFSVFLLGFFLGRQTGTAQIQVSKAVTAPSVSEPSPEPQSEQAQAEVPIDINTATAEELTALPGIGEVLAGRIVSYREQYGNYLSTEELMDVSGISEKKYEAIKDYITIGG